MSTFQYRYHRWQIWYADWHLGGPEYYGQGDGLINARLGAAFV